MRAGASELESITSRVNWGMLARRGHFEIKTADLQRIGVAMSAGVNVTLMQDPADRRRFRREDSHRDGSF